MKTFLCIGAGPGISYATAEKFAREGFRIVLAARNGERVGILTRRLTDQGFSAISRLVDAADPGAVANLITATEAEFSGLDVLHYNAAHLHQATIEQQDAGTFNHDLAINIGGAMAASQTAIKIMSARSQGTVLLTGGGWGLYPNPDYISVSVGKAGIRALSLALFEPSRYAGVHVATVTVAALVKPDSREAEGIAHEFWKLHSQPVNEWTAETVFEGE